MKSLYVLLALLLESAFFALDPLFGAALRHQEMLIAQETIGFVGLLFLPPGCPLPGQDIHPLDDKGGKLVPAFRSYQLIDVPSRAMWAII